MAKARTQSTENFTASIVGIVIAVIVVAAVAVPILGSMVGTDGTPSGATYPIQEGTMLATLVEIIPVFLILAVILMVVGVFLSKKY